MNCPICNNQFKYIGLGDIKDYHCPNKHCLSREFNYIPHLRINPNWYFCEAYNLPFIDNEKIYYVSGPKKEIINKNLIETVILGKIIKEKRTQFYGYTKPQFRIIFPSFSSVDYHLKYNKLLSQRYMALPANNDFSREFEILKNKVLRLLVLK